MCVCIMNNDCCTGTANACNTNRICVVVRLRKYCMNSVFQRFNECEHEHVQRTHTHTLLGQNGIAIHDNVN